MKDDFKTNQSQKRTPDMTRSEQESREHLPEIENNAPKDRFQQKQQVQNVESGNDIEATKSSFSRRKSNGSNSSVKQDVISHVLSGAPGGDVDVESSRSRNSLYGGDLGVISSSAAMTPSVKQSRSESRSGKRLDDTIKKLNFVPSEQVEVVRDESKPIAESRDVQGYNGTYRNSFAIAQKNQGGVPGTLMFQRSIDEIKRDQMYFSAGQTIKKANVDYQDTPTITVEYDKDTGLYTTPDDPNYPIKRANYWPRKLNISIKNGRLTKFKFDTELLETTTDDNDVANASSTAELRHINSSEIDRQNMDAKAGDEKADIWTPLARAVRQPSQTVAYLKDMERDTGNTVWFAYKKLALALSYQLNRASKDGLTTVRPRNEALLGLLYNPADSSGFGDLDNNNGNAPAGNPFTNDSYKQGAASLALALLDSVVKYKNKGDMLALPKTFKSFMQIADNNMNPLRVDKDFIAVVNNREVFSTIDRNYDPLLPVMISDREALIYPYDWNDLYSFEDVDEFGRPEFSQGKSPFRYSYHDLRNNYVVTVEHPLLKGIADFLSDNASTISQIKGTAEKDGPLGDCDISIPIIYSTCYFSLWEAIVLAATPYIVRARINSMRDVLYYEQNVEYPFSNLVKIAEANPMNAVNYTNSDYQQPIKVGTMMPSVAITWTMPELFWTISEDASLTDQYVTMAPWYFSENEYDFDYTLVNEITRKPGEHAITMPSIRTGIRSAYADMLYSMSERDIRLSMDILTALPATTEKDADKNGVYKYDQMSDGIPVFNWKKADFTLRKFLSLPRQLGYFLVAPYGVLCPILSSSEEFTSQFADMDDGMDGKSSYSCKIWTGYYGDGITDNLKNGSSENILKSSSISVNRGTAYVQRWFVKDCGRADTSKDLGFSLSLGDMFNADKEVIKGMSQFSPFTNGEIQKDGTEKQQTDNRFEVISLQKGLWTRIQMLPFALSPWDFASTLKSAGQDGVKYDPFDMMYAFGCCGFRASDYTEDVYNRDNMISNMGSTFLRDPWVDSSPIFRESVRLTQV